LLQISIPVSAYLKLRPLQPRFLLESVEGGIRLARYSFLGFGDSVDTWFDRNGFRSGAGPLAKPASQREYLDLLRAALKEVPELAPAVEGLPFYGGLVGVSGYDIVRLFEKLPHTTKPQDGIPHAAFTAPSSLLVFDHLTRRVALLHHGSDTERQQLRTEVMRLLRGPVPARKQQATISDAAAGMSEAEFSERVEACKEYIASGNIYQIVLSILFQGNTDVAPFEVYRALRLLNPSPYMFYLEFHRRRRW